MRENTTSVRTTTALQKWSCAQHAKALPDVGKIKTIHVYDFDNTLFKTPLPNPVIWKGETIGIFQAMDTISTGGWWHDNRILSATGAGVEKEEPRAWSGWWNEQIVELIQLSMQQDDALTVLLTGRSEAGFTDLINRMLDSKGLECDMVLLKPKKGPQGEVVGSTLSYKEEVLRQIMETYLHAEEIRIYEDRVNHVKRFREFFMDYNKIQNGIGTRKSVRSPIKAEVVYVVNSTTNMDPVVEVAVVQTMLNDHNALAQPKKRLVIKKSTFYTGYLISAQDTEKLLTLVHTPDDPVDPDMKYLANSIVISPRPATNALLDKVGGMGNKLLWQVNGIASWSNKIWAVSVKTVPPNSPCYTEAPPLVVLAHHKHTKPAEANRISFDWKPVAQDKALIFETTVGEKVLLRVENEDGVEENGVQHNSGIKRKFKHEDDFTRSNGSNVNTYNQGNFRGRGDYHNNNRGGSRGRGGFRGDLHSAGQRGRGRGRDDRNDRGRGRGRGGNTGGGNHYRSLDDPGQQDNGVRYDEQYPRLGQQNQQRGGHRDYGPSNYGGNNIQDRSYQQSRGHPEDFY